LKKKLLIDEFNQQNNVTNYNEISRVKNILKIGAPLPLEPSLYSPIHHSGGNLEKAN
jgi:hypothetical protein